MADTFTRFYRPREAAARLGCTPGMLRIYDAKGILHPMRSPGGTRLFPKNEVDSFIGAGQTTLDDGRPKRVVFYVRASDGDRSRLGTQVKLLTDAYGEPMKVYRESVSGLNDHRKILDRLLDDARDGRFDVVAVTNEDRLARFGVEYLRRLLASYGVRLDVLFGKKQTPADQELMNDFMSIVASFAGRFYRLHGYSQQRHLLSDAEAEVDRREESSR